jgi:DNA-binding GntR family transcriptional regulator
MFWTSVTLSCSMPGMDRAAVSLPAYRRLAEHLRGELAEGVYADGTRLPTEAELSRDHAVSRQTVRRAMQDLVADGVVYRVPGRGTFATTDGDRYLRRLGSVDDLLGLAIDTELEILTPLERAVDVDVASRLRRDDDSVYRLTFRRLHRGDPISHTAMFLAPHIGEELTDVPELTTPGATSDTTVIGLIERRHPGIIGSADQSITVGTPPPAAAEAIGTRPDEPVLRIDRIYHDTDDVPVELAVNWYHPARYTYRVKLRRS